MFSPKKGQLTITFKLPAHKGKMATHTGTAIGVKSAPVVGGGGAASVYQVQCPGMQSGPVELPVPFNEEYAQSLTGNLDWRPRQQGAAIGEYEVFEKKALDNTSLPELT